MKTYSSFRKADADNKINVTEPGKPTRTLDIAKSQKVYPHSTSFDWGYGGSGPAQTALAILLDHTGKEDTALHYYQDFKWAFVSCWEDTWRITGEEIDKWLQSQRQEAMAHHKTPTPVKTGICGCPTGHPGPRGTPGPIQG